MSNWGIEATTPYPTGRYKMIKYIATGTNIELPVHWEPSKDHPLGHELDAAIIPTKEEIMKFRLRLKMIKMRKAE